MYYTFRSQVPNLVKNMNPRCSNMKTVENQMYHVPLPKLTKDMYRVFVNKYQIKDNQEQIDPYDILKMAANLQEVRLKEDIMFGDVIIFDLEWSSVRFLSKLTPTFLVTMLTLYKVSIRKNKYLNNNIFLQKIYSLRVKGVYVVNTIPYASTLLAIGKTLLKPKLFQRVRVVVLQGEHLILL